MLRAYTLVDFYEIFSVCDECRDRLTVKICVFANFVSAPLGGAIMDC